MSYIKIFVILIGNSNILKKNINNLKIYNYIKYNVIYKMNNFNILLYIIIYDIL